MEKLITRKEAAKILGISLTTLDEARNSVLIKQEYGAENYFWRWWNGFKKKANPQIWYSSSERS